MLSYVFPLLGCKVGNEMEMEKGESRKRERGEEDILRSFICTMVPSWTGLCVRHNHNGKWHNKRIQTDTLGK